MRILLSCVLDMLPLIRDIINVGGAGGSQSLIQLFSLDENLLNTSRQILRFILIGPYFCFVT
jgi:hypothetical protein